MEQSVEQSVERSDTGRNVERCGSSCHVGYSGVACKLPEDISITFMIIH